MQPPKKVRGVYFEKIIEQNAESLLGNDLNDLSVVLKVVAFGKTLILGGDATYENWLNDMKTMKRAKKRDDVGYDANIVKLPHHGSKKDNKEDVIHFLYSDKSKKTFAGISANGHQHPNQEVLIALEKEGIKPYCTNLTPMCGANVTEIKTLPANIEPKLAKWIKELSPDASVIQPCQGNITFTIKPHQDISIQRQFNAPCKFRGEFSKLFGI